jgi:hypothetical protein
MGTTTFTGPLYVGSIIETTGSVLGSNVDNAGFVELVQSQAVTQAASTGQSAGVYLTNIVIPAGSIICSIELYVTTAWTGTAKTVGIGTTASATAITAAAAVDGSAIGRIVASPGTDATRTTTWTNVGTTDIQIKLTSTNTGSGVGVLVVRYAQLSNTIS